MRSITTSSLARLAIAVGLSFFSTLAMAQPNPESDASTFYSSRFMLAGFLLRAANVCRNDPQGTIDAGLGLLGTPELQAISKSYPNTTRKWMELGAENFNSGVMTNGLAYTCSYANTVRQRANETTSREKEAANSQLMPRPTEKGAATQTYDTGQAIQRLEPGLGLLWAAGILAATAVILGWTAQRWKRRTGAGWFFGTFLVMLVMYFLLYMGVSLTEPPVGTRPLDFTDEVTWIALGMMTAIIGGMAATLIIATLPRR